MAALAARSRHASSASPSVRGRPSAGPAASPAAEPAAPPRSTESLARLALLPHPDQGAYRALQAEWALVRVARGGADGSAAGLVAGLAEGLPRTLGEAELAWRDRAASAAILAHAGQARGDLLGAGLLVIAAALGEVRRGFVAAAEQRAAAAALDPGRSFSRAGLLRDLARQPAEQAFGRLRE